ncbi:MAG: family 43 glycosylhydrolase [Bacteroidales bacterium]|nr:family 43 glycosylhydrolase [Bacteroidales bacterium]
MTLNPPLRNLIGALLCAILLPASLSGNAPDRAKQYTNPVLHGDYSDPDVCRVGEDYYMTASSFNCFPGLPILHSRDLVHWTLIGAALTDYPGPDGPDPGVFREKVRPGEGVWAPAIRYRDGWFMIFCGDPDRGIFMVRTRDPKGLWEPPVWLVREKGFIDPCPFWDEDGNAYLSHGCAGSRAGLKSVLFLAPMDPAGTRLLGPSRIIYDGHRTQPTIEGTKMYKRDRRYYIFAPAGGVATGWQTVLRSDSPWGPYEERVVMASAPGTVNGPHQGAWVETPSGEDWFLHFQDKGAYGRIVHLQPLAWDAAGWPLIGEDPDGDGVGQPVASFRLPECPDRKQTGNPEQQGLSGEGLYGLSPEWQYPCVPSPYWHFALPDGGIRLYSVYREEKEPNLWTCPNLLLRKFPAEDFTVTASVTFRPNPQLKGRGETAGFVAMGEDYAGFRLTDTGEGTLLQYIECKDASKGGVESAADLCLLPCREEPVDDRYASRNVPRVDYPPFRITEVRLRMEVHPVRERPDGIPRAICTFSYSQDGRRWKKAGTFTALEGRWIGARYGFHCNRPTPKNDAGCTDIRIIPE